MKQQTFKRLKHKILTVSCGLFLISSSLNAQADTYDYLPETQPVLDKPSTDIDYEQTIALFEKAEPSKAFFEHAYGYAILPTIGKVGFILGGAYGEGRVFEQGKFTGMVSMTQGTLGFQAGAQAYSQIVFFQDQRAYDEFTSGNYEFGAQASAALITLGASAEASTKGTSASANAGDQKVAADGQYYKGMAVFNIVKAGIMYEVTLGGSVYKFDPVK